MPPMQLLIMMAISSPIALNIYGPAMPDMVVSLGTTQFHVQLGITLYLLTLAVGQFFAGPLADRFGRRPLLLMGFALHMIGGLIAIFAGDVYQLLLGRVLQALGGCTGVLLTRAIVLDTYGKDKAAGVLGYVTMAIAISQAVAPTFGGYTNLVWGWQSVMAVNIVLGALVLVFAFFHLPEKQDRESGAFRISDIFSKYKLVFTSRSYFFYALSATLIASCFFAFLNGAPFIVRQELGGNSAEYGVWFLLVAGGFMLGSFLAGKVTPTLGAEKMVWAGNSLSFIAGLIMFLLFWQTEFSYEILFIPMACFTLGRGLSQPSAQASALSSAPGATGTASGMLGFIQLLCGALIAQAAPMIFQNTVMALPGLLILASLCALLSFLLGKNRSEATLQR